MPHSKAVKAKMEGLYKNTRPKPNPKNTEEDDKFLRIARERARVGGSHWKENWERAEEDLKFLSGQQWPEKVKRERELEQRPCLTNNVLPTFVAQVQGDQRQNKPSIKVSPVDGVHVNDKEGNEQEGIIENRAGKEDYSYGEVLTAAIMNIEYNCDAETAYDMAFEGVLGGGFGFLRVLSDYTADESFDQELKIKHIKNQFSVIMDPGAKEEDYHDMGWCFVDDHMLKVDFKEKYPHATPEAVDDKEDDIGKWFVDKMVRVTEYFIRKEIIRETALLSDGSVVFLDEIEPILDELLEQEIVIERTRNVKTYKVSWYLISAYNILEGPIELDNTSVPIVPVWGKSVTIRKETIYMSLIRHAKDAQRMSNYFDSAAAESVALAPKAPFIGSEEHFEGREDEWKQANTKNFSMLTYNMMHPQDRGPQRQQPAMVPAAEITLGMNATDKVKATLGMFDASIGARGNETSGKAIVARQREADVGSFAFIDNLSKAITRIGKLLVELIPKVYDTERVMRLKFQDETEDFVVLNQQVYNEETNEYVKINDLGVAKYDVIVKTGPAYSTQREESVEAMAQFVSAAPQVGPVIMDLMAQNMDWPGADEIAKRLKKTIDPNLLSEKEREKIAKDMPEQNNEPTPEQVLQGQELEVRGAEAQAKMAKAEAEAEKARQDTIQEELQTEAAKAKLAAIEIKAAGEGVDNQQVQEMIAEVFTEIIPQLVPDRTK